MALQSIGIYYRDLEVGKAGFDQEKDICYFQYNPEFLKPENYKNLFPYLIEKTARVQSFTEFKGETFRGLIPALADSLPDLFGNLVFAEWMKANNKDDITTIQQLAYVGKRGMGALEYAPSKSMSKNTYETIDVQLMSEISEAILSQKRELSESKFDHEALLNIFRVGGSAGGARPKILISEEIKSGKIVPGDTNYAADFKHYLVKLSIDSQPYAQEKVEYTYYQLATKLGIEMQPSHLIDDKHFCTLRFDRKKGEKNHILTACGMTGWDFKNAAHSNYENLFKLASNLGIPQSRLEQLYRRMVFNVIYMNIDDHLKNFSFIHDHHSNEWDISPAYDITYALNPMLVNKNVRRAMSINGKRTGLTHQDLTHFGDVFAIKNTKSILKDTIACTADLKDVLKSNNIGDAVTNRIVNSVNSNLQHF